MTDLRRFIREHAAALEGEAVYCLKITVCIVWACVVVGAVMMEVRL